MDQQQRMLERLHQLVSDEVDPPAPALEAKFGHAPISTTPEGGRQSHLEYRFDLMDEYAMMQLAHVLWYGVQRYGRDNWRLIPRDDNINRAIYHLFRHLQGDTKEDHLAHAFTRIMFALGHDNPAHGARRQRAQERAQAKRGTPDGPDHK